MLFFAWLNASLSVFTEFFTVTPDRLGSADFQVFVSALFNDATAVLLPLTALINVSMLTPQFLRASVKLKVPFVIQLTPSLPFFNSSASLWYTSPLLRTVSFSASVCFLAASAFACHAIKPIAAAANAATRTPVVTAVKPRMPALKTLKPELAPAILYPIFEKVLVTVLLKLLKADSSPAPSFVLLNKANSFEALLPIKSKLLATTPPYLALFWYMSYSPAPMPTSAVIATTAC